MPLTQEPGGTWFPLHSEVVLENGQILCTRNPTGHRVLIDYRFELPCGKSMDANVCELDMCYVELRDEVLLQSNKKSTYFFFQTSALLMAVITTFNTSLNI